MEREDFILALREIGERLMKQYECKGRHAFNEIFGKEVRKVALANDYPLGEALDIAARMRNQYAFFLVSKEAPKFDYYKKNYYTDPTLNKRLCDASEEVCRLFEERFLPCIIF